MATRVQILNSGAIVQEVTKTGRIPRRPAHEFNLKNKPWAIQPFAIAPVLPGETLKNALLQARVVTDPIKAPLIGWWTEFYLFYVKLRDLDARDELTNMLMVPGANVNGLKSGADMKTGHVMGINYMRLCLDRVVDEYFRDEGDNPPLIETLPAASFKTKENWLDSAKLESALPVGGDDTILPGDAMGDGTIPAGFEQHYQQWLHMKSLKMVDATFEDYLKQFGVRVPAAVREDTHKPELLRYTRDWSYPTNTVDAATGSPSSAVSWSVAERSDKDRFFQEPGFVFGVSVTRPKVYLGRQFSRAVSMLDDAMAWLPALMSGDPYTSLKRFGANEGPLAAGDARHPSEAYWVDVRDLFLYGDQLRSDWNDDSGINAVPYPADSLQRRYATEADATALFKDPAKSWVRMDGVLNLDILGAQRDAT